MLAGRYLLVDRIGAGGTGAVWRARDLRTGAWVAAKVLGRHDPSLLLRFVHEQSVRIVHPHVLTPIGWAAEDDVVVLATALVRGGSVADLLAEHGPLPEPLVRVLLDQTLRGLAAVHAAGIVHLDVKPANLLLEPTGRGRPHLRVADFGVAAPRDPAGVRWAGLAGTDGYLAPERLRGAPGAPAPGRVRRRRGRRRAAHRPPARPRARRAAGPAPAAAGRDDRAGPGAAYPLGRRRARPPAPARRAGPARRARGPRPRPARRPAGPPTASVAARRLSPWTSEPTSSRPTRSPRPRPGRRRWCSSSSATRRATRVPRCGTPAARPACAPTRRRPGSTSTSTRRTSSTSPRPTTGSGSRRASSSSSTSTPPPRSGPRG